MAALTRGLHHCGSLQQSLEYVQNLVLVDFMIFVSTWVPTLKMREKIKVAMFLANVFVLEMVARLPREIDQNRVNCYVNRRSWNNTDSGCANEMG